MITYSYEWNVLTEGGYFGKATLHLNLISYMLIRNIQGQHYSCDVKSTCNWHDFELQMHGFPHILIIHCDAAWYNVE